MDCLVHLGPAALRGCVGAKMVVRRVQRDAELTGVAPGLGEQQTALDSGQRGSGELVGIRPAIELATGLHRAEALTDVFFPALERGLQLQPGLLVGLRQLPYE